MTCIRTCQARLGVCTIECSKKYPAFLNTSRRKLRRWRRRPCPAIAISQQEPAWGPRDGAMAPPQRRRATSPPARRPARTSPRGAASAPGDHTRLDHPGTRRRLRGHAAAPPTRGRHHRPARHILTRSLLPPMPGDVFQRPARVVRASSVERRAIRNVARRAPPGASARLRGLRG